MATKRIKDLATGTPSAGAFLPVDPASGSTYKVPLGPGRDRVPFHASDGRGVELEGVRSVAHLAGEFTIGPGGGRWFRLFQITLGNNYLGARGEIWFGRPYDGSSQSSRLAYHVGSKTLPANEARLALAPGLPASGDSTTGVITDAAIVQTGANTYELWVQAYTEPGFIAWHHQGAVYDTAKISYAPLQAASLPTPVSGGLNVQWSTLSSSSTSLGWFGRIVQSGSNSNGSYIRYDDGTQICWATAVGAGPDPQTITYPAAFSISPLLVITSADWPAFRFSIDSTAGYSTTSQKIRKYNADGTPYTGASAPSDYIAIGRWK